MGRANERKGFDVVCGPSLSHTKECNNGGKLLGTTPPPPCCNVMVITMMMGATAEGGGGNAKVMAMNQREMMCAVSPHHPLMMVTMADHPGE